MVCCIYNQKLGRNLFHFLETKTFILLDLFSYLAPNSLPQDVLMAFVVGEHILLGVAWAINKAIPDRPWWVRVALAKADYESRQAMKREVKV